MKKLIFGCLAMLLILPCVVGATEPMDWWQANAQRILAGGDEYLYCILRDEETATIDSYVLSESSFVFIVVRDGPWPKEAQMAFAVIHGRSVLRAMLLVGEWTEGEALVLRPSRPFNPYTVVPYLQRMIAGGNLDESFRYGMVQSWEEFIEELRGIVSKYPAEEYKGPSV